jgi:uncharacterized membrane protein
MPHPGPVLPTRDDPWVTTASGAVGGPAGERVRADSGWWTALRIVLVLTTIVLGTSVLLKQPCRADAWTGGDQYTHACYSDIPFLFGARGKLADGGSPYAAAEGTELLEYPVLSGGMMWLTAVLVPDAPTDAERNRRFYDYTVFTLVLGALVAAWATARTHRRRPWDAAMFALAPGLLLTATINWDLYAVAFTALFMLAWSRSRPGLAGVLLGLAVAAKFYPLFLLGPLFLLCLRAGRLRAFGRTLGAGVATWVAVNLPVYLAWPEGWKRFYLFSSDRGWDYGSLWYALDLRGHPVVANDDINVVASGTFLVLCIGIAVLALTARRRPRFAQLAFLVVAAFLVTNKVYSPQFVLWLIPLAALARPRWRDFVVWQGCEVVYFFSVWWFIQGQSDAKHALPGDWYALAILVHIAGTLYFAAFVVRDVLRPGDDPIRAEDPSIDDPGGGVLDGAPDRFTLRRGRGRGADVAEAADPVQQPAASP